MRKNLISIFVRNEIEEISKTTKRKRLSEIASASHSYTYLTQSAPDLGHVLGCPMHMHNLVQGHTVMNEGMMGKGEFNG